MGVDTGTGSAIPKMRVMMVSMMPTAIIMPVGPGVRKYSQEAPSPCTRGATQAPLRRIDERQLTVWRVVYMCYLCWHETLFEGCDELGVAPGGIAVHVVDLRAGSRRSRKRHGRTAEPRTGS